jgi:tetratricopeptide (TPR) repeat protein
VSQKGSLELLKGTVRITILKDGVYSMAALTKNTAAAGTGPVGNAITQKLQSLVTEKPRQSQVGGVRGAEQSGGSVMWVGGDDEVRSEVESFFAQAQYAEAVNVLMQAITEAVTDADRDEFTYLLGAAYYGAGQTAKAFRTLSAVSPQLDALWYARYVILKAQVLLDTQEYKDALALLAPFVSTFPTGEATQVALLLTYFCQKGLGDQAAAGAALEAGYKLDAATDTAKLIEQQRRAP